MITFDEARKAYAELVTWLNVETLDPARMADLNELNVLTALARALEAHECDVWMEDYYERAETLTKFLSELLETGPATDEVSAAIRELARVVETIREKGVEVDAEMDDDE